MDDAQTVLDRFEHLSEQIIAGLAGLHTALERAGTPARRRTFRLSATKAYDRDEGGRRHASYGILNPSPVIVYLGIGGDGAGPGRGSISVPGNSVLVLPLSVEDVDLAVDPADPNLALGEAVFHTLRFESVQPLALGAL